MRQKHENLFAYILHARPFRETSLLIDFFTRELGRCSGVGRGVYRGKSPTRSLLQPFNGLTVSLQGSGELLSLTRVERADTPLDLTGDALICGFYLNELLVYTLHRHDAHPRLFDAYQTAITALSEKNNPPEILREFEFILLEALGYGVSFSSIERDEETFSYHPELGFQRAMGKTESPFSGKILKEIAKKNWQSQETLLAAKRLTRLALAPLLNGKEIRSRELL